MNNLYNIQGKLINLQLVSEICVCDEDLYSEYKYHNKEDNRYYLSMAWEDRDKGFYSYYYGASISAELKNSSSIKFCYFGNNEIIINFSDKAERDRVFNTINQKFNQLIKSAQVI